MTAKYAIEVAVNGGVTGHRVSLLKSNGDVRSFDTRIEAQTEVARYISNMNRPGATASYSARVVTLND